MMGNLITIYRGDENRAKIDTTLQPGDFFDTAYNRAFQALEKIVCETKEYNAEKEQCGYKNSFHGMGNNTIIFTAERGQGKTSAMLSFAEVLKRPKQSAGRMRNMDSVGFCVLDAIDPAVFDKTENIIRVLLSRLYFEFDKCVGDCLNHKNDGREIAANSETFLNLLMGCYDNIEALKGNSNRNEEEDDLEHLAQMGNSAKLKENLSNLIDVFLKLTLSKDYRYHYLVIQIDDVDLSTGDIYDICEDIHRYFSVPNVVVLMAADYSQLRYALCEKYLKQYKELQDGRSKVKIYDKCHDMATRYLEKVFPESHRIELPVLRNIMAEDYASLRICYCNKPIIKRCCGGDREEKIYQVEQLCAYLMRRLYLKTGIILLNPADRIHPLLPRTMRELTHFLNLLDEMPDIDMIAVYSDFTPDDVKEDLKSDVQKEAGKSVPDDHMAERENLLNNLSRLKRYYLYDWCANHLDEAQWDLIQAIENCETQRKLQLTVSLLGEYINQSGKENFEIQEISYYAMMQQIENNKVLQTSIDFQYALLVYYGLFLNEWFIKAMGKVHYIRKLTDFVGDLVYATEKIKDCKVNGFSVNSFEVSSSILKKRLEKGFAENTGHPYKIFLGAVCVPQALQEKQQADEIDPETERWVSDIWPSTVATKMLDFNFFRLLPRMLWDRFFQEKVMDYQESADAKQSSADDGFAGRRFTETILALKNAMTNYQVQQKIQRNVERMAEAQKTQRQSADSLRRYYEQLGNVLDTWLEGTEYTADIVPVVLGEALKKCGGESGCLNDILLSGEENIEAYRTCYAKNIQKLLFSLRSDMEQFRSILEKEHISGDELAKIPSLRGVEWDNLKPELILERYEMPEDQRMQQWCTGVKNLRVTYEQIMPEIKNYFSMKSEDGKGEMPVPDERTAEEIDTEGSVQIVQEGQAVISKTGCAAEEAMKEGDSEKQGTRSDDSGLMKEKREALLKDINKYITLIEDTEKELNASGAGKS